MKTSGVVALRAALGPKSLFLELDAESESTVTFAGASSPLKC